MIFRPCFACSKLLPFSPNFFPGHIGDSAVLLYKKFIEEKKDTTTYVSITSTVKGNSVTCQQLSRNWSPCRLKHQWILI